MNRLDLVKALAPGFLPLLVFLLADSLWGTEVGLAVAIASGLLELGASGWRRGELDRFVLLDTGLIVVLGGVSLLLDNDIFFLLKPALIEALLCAFLAVSIFTPHNLLLGLTRRYLRGIDISDSQEREMMRSFRLLLALLAGHTLLVVFAALFLSRAAWGFISGGLFYIVFVLFLGAEWLRKRRQRRLWREQYRDDEWFDIVDRQGRVRGRAPRTVCHSGRGLLHPVVHLHVLNGADQLLLQKRSAAKAVQPGKWDTAVGGHVHSGETVETALRREALEEIGLRDFRPVLLARYVWESDIESELVTMYATRSAQPVTIDPGEISEARFWKIRKIRESLGKGVLTPNFEFEFPILQRLLFGQNETEPRKERG